MDISKLSRKYLESLSTSDLIELSNDYGIDIPENLDRNFIIGELLEAAEENETEDEDVKVSESTVDVPQKLPDNYGDTKIRAILHNPAWAFVFWEVRKRSSEKLILRTVFLEDKESDKSDDYFDIETKNLCGDQYIMIPAGKKIFMVELYEKNDDELEKIASTKKIEIPSEGLQIKGLQPGKKTDFPKLIELSGIEDLLSSQYRDHRQSF